MVQEIEINNTTEVLASGLQSPDFENTPSIISASLSANGTLMTVKVNRLMGATSFRKLILTYMLPSYEQQLVAEYELGVYDASDSVDQTTEYTFDLTPVLSTIMHEVPEQLADDTVSVRLYTYEANTSFNYGTCYPQYSAIVAYAIGEHVQYGGRLWQCKKASTGNLPTDTTYWNPTGVPSSGTLQFNVPYTVSYPGSSVIPASTDGWYALKVLDVDLHDVLVNYVVDDIVIYAGAYYSCTTNTVGTLPTNINFWAPLSTEQERSLYEFGHESSQSIKTILNSNMLITRHVKQKYIYELLQKSNYKRYDNVAVVNQLEKIFSMREAAIVHLNMGNPIQARYMLDLIQIEVNSFMKNNGEGGAVGTLINFTI